MPIRRTEFESGLRVVTERIPGVRSVALGFWVLAGSRDEPPPISGSSHFLEHLLFKGTKTRTARDIAEAFDAVGGDVNAFTAKEYTCFYSRVRDRDLPMAVDHLSDMLQHSVIRTSDLEAERQVILEEIHMHEDTPDDLIHDLLNQTLWPDHPLGRPILGTRQAVQEYGRDAVHDHFVEAYTPPRIIIAVAGNVTHERAIELFGAGFNGFSRQSIDSTDPAPALKPGVNIVHKELEQVHLVMGFPGLSHVAPERYALFLLNDVIGGSMSSRLFQEVRERQGLVYSIHSGVQAFRDTGVLYVYAATDAGNFSKVLKSTLKEIRDLKKNGVSADDLKRSKDHLKGSLMLSLESTSSRMNRLAKHEMHLGSFLTMDQMIQAIERVKHEEVQALVSELIDEDRLALTTYGPLDRRNLPRELLRH